MFVCRHWHPSSYVRPRSFSTSSASKHSVSRIWKAFTFAASPNRPIPSLIFHYLHAQLLNETVCHSMYSPEIAHASKQDKRRTLLGACNKMNNKLNSFMCLVFLCTYKYIQCCLSAPPSEKRNLAENEYDISANTIWLMRRSSSTYIYILIWHGTENEIATQYGFYLLVHIKSYHVRARWLISSRRLFCISSSVYPIYFSMQFCRECESITISFRSMLARMLPSMSVPRASLPKRVFWLLHSLFIYKNMHGACKQCQAVPARRSPPVVPYHFMPSYCIV